MPNGWIPTPLSVSPLFCSFIFKFHYGNDQRYLFRLHVNIVSPKKRRFCIHLTIVHTVPYYRDEWTTCNQIWCVGINWPYLKGSFNCFWIVKNLNVHKTKTWNLKFLRTGYTNFVLKDKHKRIWYWSSLQENNLGTYEYPI